MTSCALPRSFQIKMSGGIVLSLTGTTDPLEGKKRLENRREKGEQNLEKKIKLDGNIFASGLRDLRSGHGRTGRVLDIPNTVRGRYTRVNILSGSTNFKML